MESFLGEELSRSVSKELSKELPGRGKLAWVLSTENSKRPLTRDFIWTKRMLPFLKPIGLDWATFQVMRRTHASRSKEAGVDAHTRSTKWAIPSM